MKKTGVVRDRRDSVDRYFESFSAFALYHVLDCEVEDGEITVIGSFGGFFVQLLVV